jgi:hypothetical protein
MQQLMKNNSPFDKTQIHKVEEPKILKRNWCLEPIRCHNLLNANDNSNNLFTQKYKLLEKFMEDFDQIDRILRRMDDYYCFQEYDTIPVARTPNGFYSSYLSHNMK